MGGRIREVRASKSTFKRTVARISTPALGRTLRHRALPVLCYHRVVDEVEEGLFEKVNSARPERFETHLEMLGAGYSFVDDDLLSEWLRGRAALPPRPVMLTFDDGYRDNYETVYPLLKRRGIPATFFLATEHIDNGDWLWWDLAAAIFSVRQSSEADLPLLGRRSFSTSPSSQDATEWIDRAKRVPDDVRRAALEDLSSALGVVAVPNRPDVSMTWAQAREMADNGMSFGGHSATHPILSRMEAEKSRAEIEFGLARLREELGRKMVTFAYPNGGREDFGAAEQKTLHEVGIGHAFSLLPGPASLQEVRKDPLAIRRIYVGESDDADSLQLKMLGLGRVASLLRRS